MKWFCMRLLPNETTVLNVVAMNDSDRVFLKIYCQIKGRRWNQESSWGKAKQKQENIERNSSISSIDPASNQQQENLPK
jgi:hypothetical protein